MSNIAVSSGVFSNLPVMGRATDTLNYLAQLPLMAYSH